jgi:5,6,7,8-tetrahydromethanopterin hydro-lyase
MAKPAKGTSGVIHIGEGFEGSGANAAHINLILGSKAVLGAAFATAAANPGPGHIPFQAVLRPNLPAKPVTLFVAKSVLKDANHETMTWGPAQAGVAAGITLALLDKVLPAEAEDGWLAIALVWVDPKATKAQQVYAHNLKATYAACQRAMTPGWPDRQALAEGVANVSNPFFTPRVR